jgi:hypothetical protein
MENSLSYTPAKQNNWLIKGTTFFVLFICCMHSFTSYTQPCHGNNLVNNPGFESYDTCPYKRFQIFLATHWFDTDYHGDFFHICAVSPLITWAFNYQMPRNNSLGMAGVVFLLTL